MKERILSLDLGPNSIGATTRNLLEEDQFERATVITSETGVAEDKIQRTIAKEKLVPIHHRNL